LESMWEPMELPLDCRALQGEAGGRSCYLSVQIQSAMVSEPSPMGTPAGAWAIAVGRGLNRER